MDGFNPTQMIEAASNELTNMGRHAVADPGRQVRGGDLYISYLGFPGVRYLAGLSGILDLYPV